MYSTRHAVVAVYRLKIVVVVFFVLMFIDSWGSFKRKSKTIEKIMISIFHMIFINIDYFRFSIFYENVKCHEIYLSKMAEEAILLVLIQSSDTNKHYLSMNASSFFQLQKQKASWIQIYSVSDYDIVLATSIHFNFNNNNNNNK